MTDTRLVEAARDAIRAANLGKVDAMDAERREPPTCRTCEWCSVAPYPYGAGRHGIGWCGAEGEWVRVIDEDCNCSEWTPNPAPEQCIHPRADDLLRSRVYLSGPMRGEPDMNRAAFRLASGRVMDAGAAEVYDPSALADTWDPDPLWLQSEREQAMMEDLRELTRRDQHGPYWDFVVQLPGWSGSEGAELEWRVARAIGIPVFELRDVRGLA